MARKGTDVLRLVAASEAALAAGNRDEAIVKARAAVLASPRHIDANRRLAEALTMHDVYQHNPELGRRLAADGSLEEAVAIRKLLIELGVEEYDNYLQIGYCLTALGDLQAAALAIRHATDLSQRVRHPASRAGLTDEVLKPSFFIIGSQKCGTTSLFRYISNHPQVIPPIIKEIHYFLHPDRGLDWYFAHFPRRPESDTTFVTGEASVSTINLNRAPRLIGEIDANARIMALARDPIDRAISQYYNYRQWGIDDRSLEDAINQELDLLENMGSGEEYWKKQLGYTWLGLYAKDLERWFAAFPAEQVSILITEEMQAEPASTVDGIFQFLGLPPHKLERFDKHHRGRYDDQDQSRVRERMKAFFRGPNEQFFELIGRRLDWGGEEARYAGPPVASASRARILLNQARWKEASEEFEKCLAVAPSHPSRKEWLEQAIKARLKAGDWVGAKARLPDLLEVSPGNDWAAGAQVEAVLQSGDQHEVIRVIDDSMRQFPRHAKRRDWLILLAKAHLGLRQLERAEQAYQLLAVTFPNEPSAVSGLAQLAQERGFPTHAMKLWEVCIERFPDHRDRRWWLVSFAHLLMRQGQLERAGEIIARQIDEFPADAGGISSLALLEQRKANPQRATELWAECLRKFPDHPDRRWWLPTLANLLIDRGDVDQAESAIDELMISYPDEPGALVCLARIAAKRENADRAAEIWEECLRRFPGHPERRWWLPTFGHVLLNMKKIERSEEIFQQLLFEYPGDPIGKAGLARVAFERGQWRQAADLWQESLDTSPGHQNRPEWENMRGIALSRAPGNPSN